MKVTSIKIKKVVPKNGLVGFAAFVIDNDLYLGNVAVFSRLNKTGLRLVFPEKKIENKIIKIFYPVSQKFYYELEKLINEKFI